MVKVGRHVDWLQVVQKRSRRHLHDSNMRCTPDPSSIEVASLPTKAPKA